MSNYFFQSCCPIKGHLNALLICSIWGFQGDFGKVRWFLSLSMTEWHIENITMFNLLLHLSFELVVHMLMWVWVVLHSELNWIKCVLSSNSIPDFELRWQTRYRIVMWIIYINNKLIHINAVRVALHWVVSWRYWNTFHEPSSKTCVTCKSLLTTAVGWHHRCAGAEYIRALGKNIIRFFVFRKLFVCLCTWSLCWWLGVKKKMFRRCNAVPTIWVLYVLGGACSVSPRGGWLFSLWSLHSELSSCLAPDCDRGGCRWR